MLARRVAHTLMTHLCVASLVAVEAFLFPRGVNSPPWIDPQAHLALAAAWMYGVMAVGLAGAAQFAALWPSAFRKFKPGDIETLHFTSTQCLVFAFIAFQLASARR